MSIKLKIYDRKAPVPSRMLALAKILIKKGPMRRRDVYAYLNPSIIDAAQEAEDEFQSIETIQETLLFKEIIDAAKECGLITIEGLENTISLSPNLDKKNIFLDDIDKNFPILMADLVLKPKINNEKNLFARVCAWFLNQPIFGNPQDHDGWKRLLLKQCGDLLKEARLRGNSEWDNVAYWLRYLGLASRTISEGIKGLYPDPTLYIERHIEKLIFPKEQITANKFRERLGALCPVIDGGSVFYEMRPKEHSDDLLSDSLSFALERLKHKKILSFWCPIDPRDFLRLNNQEKIAFLSREVRK